MDEALEVGLARIAAGGVALEVELHEVAALDPVRAERAREEKAPRVARVPHADVAVGVDDVLVRQDAVGDDEVVEGGLDFPGLHHLPGAVRAAPEAASRSSASRSEERRVGK